MIPHETPNVTLPGLISLCRAEIARGAALGNTVQLLEFTLSIDSPYNEHEPYALVLDVWCCLMRPAPGGPTRLWSDGNAVYKSVTTESGTDWVAVTSVRDCWWVDDGNSGSGGTGGGGVVVKNLAYDIQMSVQKASVGGYTVFAVPRSLTMTQDFTHYIDASTTTCELEFTNNSTVVGTVSINNGSVNANFTGAQLSKGDCLMMSVKSAAAPVTVIVNLICKVT